MDTYRVKIVLPPEHATDVKFLMAQWAVGGDQPLYEGPDDARKCFYQLYYRSRLPAFHVSAMLNTVLGDDLELSAIAVDD